MNALLNSVSTEAVMTAGTLHVVDPNLYRKQLAKMKLGEGECVEIRISRAEEAKRRGQVRLWFALIREISDYTGYDVKEMHEMGKAVAGAPDAPTSLADWTKDQMSEAISNLLRWSAETVGLRLEAA